VTRTALVVVRPEHRVSAEEPWCCGEVNNLPSEGCAPEGVANRTIGPPASHKGMCGPFCDSLGRNRLPSAPACQGVTDEAHVPAEHAEASQEARLPPSHVDARGAGDHPGPAAEGPPPAVGLSSSGQQSGLDGQDLANPRPGDIRRPSPLESAGAARTDHGNVGARRPRRSSTGRLRHRQTRWWRNGAQPDSAPAAIDRSGY